MNTLSANFLENIYTSQKENSLHGKWITYKDIEKLFSKYALKFDISQIGTSEEKRPIMQLKIGSGSKKILVWSQMHGNESTGTKAIFDLLNCISNFLGSDLFKNTRRMYFGFYPNVEP